MNTAKLAINTEVVENVTGQSYICLGNNLPGYPEGVWFAPLKRTTAVNGETYYYMDENPDSHKALREGEYILAEAVRAQALQDAIDETAQESALYPWLDMDIDDMPDAYDGRNEWEGD